MQHHGGGRPESDRNVHVRGAAVIGGASTVDAVRVGDVDDALIWAETNSIWTAKAVGHGPDGVDLGVIAIHLAGQTGRRPEALLEAVDGVGEPDGAV